MTGFLCEERWIKIVACVVDKESTSCGKIHTFSRGKLRHNDWCGFAVAKVVRYCAWAHWLDSEWHWSYRERGEIENHLCLSVAVMLCFKRFQCPHSWHKIAAVNFNTHLSHEQKGCPRLRFILSNESFITQYLTLKRWLLLELTAFELHLSHVAGFFNFYLGLYCRLAT